MRMPESGSSSKVSQSSSMPLKAMIKPKPAPSPSNTDKKELANKAIKMISSATNKINNLERQYKDAVTEAKLLQDKAASLKQVANEKKQIADIAQNKAIELANLKIRVPVPSSTGLETSTVRAAVMPPTTPAAVAPTPTAFSPTGPTQVTVPTAAAPVKTAPIDTVLFNDETVSIEFMTDLIFENIGGHELINIARNDIVNGQDISYQPIKNLTSLQQQYNPNNILSLQSTSDKYFANFSIKLENKVPNFANGPFGSNVYLDPLTGDMVVDAINLESDEQIEMEITLSGTIYETDLTGSES